MFYDKLIVLFRYLPTILFILIIFLGALVGFLRGYRKTLKSIVEFVIILALFILLYCLLVDNRSVDMFFLKIVNLFMGEDGLQQKLNITQECSGLQDVMLYYMANLYEKSPALANAIVYNSAYVYTLGNLVYHICFAIILSTLYSLVIFIIFLIRCLLFTNYRHNKKEKRNFLEGNTYYREHKGRWLGLLLGALRGCFSALIFISLFGSLYFALSGGDGTSRLEEPEVEDEKINMALGTYTEMTDYGNHGIFKLFNKTKDANGVPIYLHFSDFIMSGSYVETNDKGEEIGHKINLRNEVATYTRFVKDMNNLMIQYQPEEYKKLLNKESVDTNALIYELLADPNFQYDFKSIILQLKDGEFVIDLSFSMLDSFACYINDFGITRGMDANTVELINILFNKGYYSTSIPYEVEYVATHGTIALSNQPFPYLKPSDIISVADYSVLLETAFYLINYLPIKFTTDMVFELLPHVERLSIFGSENASTLNPVLARLFAFTENTYLAGTKEAKLLSAPIGGNYVTVADINIYDDKVDWIQEILVLIQVSKNIQIILKNISSQKDTFQNLLAIFDEEVENYEMNQIAVENIFNFLDKSTVVHKVLSTNIIKQNLDTSLANISPSFVYPENIQFQTIGNSKGELYHFIQVIKYFASKEGKELLDKLQSFEEFDQSILKDLASAFNVVDSEGELLLNHFIDSAIIESLISALLIDKCKDILIIPDAAKVINSNGEIINIIQKEELQFVFTNFNEILSLIDLSGDNIMKQLDQMIDMKKDNQYVLDTLLESKIVSINVANILMNTISETEGIIIPEYLQNNINEWNNSKEINKLLNALRIDGIDLSVLQNIDGSQLMDIITNLSEENIRIALESDLLYYNIEKHIKDLDLGIKLLIPNVVYETYQGSKLIKRDEIVQLVRIAQALFSENETLDTNTVLSILLNNETISQQILDDEILGASIANYLVNESNYFNEDISLTNELKSQGNSENIYLYQKGCVWYYELHSFVYACKRLKIIDESGNIVENPADICIDYFNDSIRNYDTKKEEIQAIYQSQIISKAISKSFVDSMDDQYVNDVYDKKYQKEIIPFAEIDCMIELFHCSNLDLNNISLENIKNNLTFDELNQAATESYLLRAKITGLLITSFNLELHKRAIDNLGILTEKEATSLLHFLIVEDIDIDDIKTIQIIAFKPYLNEEGEFYSYTLSSVFSNIIVQLDLIIPMKAMKTYVNADDLILYSEVVIFYEVLDFLNLKTLNDVETFEMDVNVLDMVRSDSHFREIVCDSLIFRATLTSKITLSDSTEPLYVAVDEADKLTTIEMESTIVTHKDSLLALLNAVATIIKDDFTISESDIYLLLGHEQNEEMISSSSTLRIAITNHIIKMTKHITAISLPKGDLLQVYNISKCQKEEIEVFSIETMLSVKEMIDSIPTPFI